MLMRGYRFRLQPNVEQENLFRQFSGVCRLVYNLALEQRRDWWRQYRRETGKSLNYVAQARELTALRASIDWIAAVSQTCQQQALRDLDKAFAAFYAGRAGYPTPRKKGTHESFRFQGREVEVKKLNSKWSAAKLPKIGWVKFRDTRPIMGTVKNVTINLSSTGWHIVFACEIDQDITAHMGPAVGIDRGVANTLTLSTGERRSLPETLERLERRLRKAQRVLARRKRGSRRYAKARSRVAALRSRQARIRKDWLHRQSLDIAQRFSLVAIEALNTKAMTVSARGTMEEPGRNVRAKAGLNRSILAQGWGLFEQLLAYKLEERGGSLIKVDPRHTSQTCSACGALDRRARESQARFVCRACGHHAHADHNAAINILRQNTASMDVEEGHWFSVEAFTGRAKGPENLPL